MSEPSIPLSHVHKLFKKFMTEEIHEADFDQGQDLNDTIGVFKRWWRIREPILKKKYNK